MAVRHKTGLDYFPLDVDIFSDEKMEFVAARFGMKGELIVIKLLCKIYRNGYYSEFTEDDNTLFAKRAGEGITPTLVNEVINECFKRGFFDKSLFERFNILTSKGIQNRYFEAVERRKDVNAERQYLLLDMSKYENVNIIEPNVNISPPNDDIPKQSKVKEKKVKYRENVILREKENFSLVEEFGQDFINRVYDYFSNYKLEKGYKNKDDNLTIRRWVLDAVREKEAKKAPAGNQQSKRETLLEKHKNRVYTEQDEY